MSFVWQDYLVLAHELTGDGAPTAHIEEARLRSALSRAYYAVFCQARLHLTVAEGNTSIAVAENVHYEVSNQFSINSDLAHQLIGEHLGTLRRYRNQADYEQDVVNLSGKVRAALAIADWVMENMDALPDSL